jgi:hypothetical protein
VNKNISYNDKRNTIMIEMNIVVRTTTAPQLNNILQLIQRCEVAIGVGQRAADFRIAVQIPSNK